MRCNLVIIALFPGLVVVAQTVNHNAVLITGDTPEGVAEKIQNALESGDTLYDSLGLWGFQEARQESVRHSYNEFWNDTYLMWEFLYAKEWPDEDIHFSLQLGKLFLQKISLDKKVFMKAIRVTKLVSRSKNKRRASSATPN